MDAIEQAKSEAPVAPAPRKLMKMVKVKEPVSFAGPADMTMLAKDGDLELDETLRLIVAKPNDPKRDPCIVPLENVTFMVPLDRGTSQKLAEAKAEKIAAPPVKGPTLPPGVRPPKPKGDTVKFVRGPDGKPMEVIE